MTTSITLEAAQAQLPTLIHDMPSGSQVAVTLNGVAVATITREATWPSVPGTAIEDQPAAQKPRRVLGAQRGSVLYMAPDFDEPIEGLDDELRPAGTAKDRILWMAEDFNAPLDHFDEDSE